MIAQPIRHLFCVWLTPARLLASYMPLQPYQEWLIPSLSTKSGISPGLATLWPPGPQISSVDLDQRHCRHCCHDCCTWFNQNEFDIGVTVLRDCRDRNPYGISKQVSAGQMCRDDFCTQIKAWAFISLSHHIGIGAFGTQAHSDGGDSAGEVQKDDSSCWCEELGKKNGLGELITIGREKCRLPEIMFCLSIKSLLFGLILPFKKILSGF